MSFIPIICFLVFAVTFAVNAETPSKEKIAWLAEQREILERAQQSPDDKSLEELAKMIYGVGMHLSTASNDTKQMHHEACSFLLTIPGLQERYRDRINVERAKYDEILKTGNVTQITDQRLKWADAKSAFAVMKYLPSVETVKVLGEFLADERGRMTVAPDASYEEKVEVVDNLPASDYAMFTFDGMPIVAKPYKRPGASIPEREMPAALAAWRAWYEQIKAGNRTFRFEGDPTEYDLNGPAPRDKLVRIERDRKRDEERMAGHKRTSSGSETESAIRQLSKPSAIAGGLAGCALVAVAVWYLLSGRKTA